MISKEYGMTKLVCDCCGEKVEGFQTFYDAVDYAEKNGWGREYSNGEWQNTCPVCQEE